MPRASAFISHSPEDSAAAREVEAALRGLGLETLSSEAVDRGEPRAVGDAISSQDLLVLLWSRHSARSEIVEFQWNAAIALRKAIVPCLLDETPLQPSLTSLQGVRMHELKDSIPLFLSSPPDAADEEAQSTLLAALDEVPAGDATSMARSATLLLKRAEGSDPDAATILSSPPAGDQSSQASSSGPAGAASSGTVFQVGARIANRYELRRLIGEGGMGAVYQAYDSELDRDVALKVIRPEIANHPEILERFKREIQLSSTVTHHNVLRVYDLGESGGARFLTMQYVEGESLLELMRREGRLPLERALDIFRQICEGLRAAHEQGVIHRDLKPDNVMLDARQRVLLTDFGLAKSLQQTAMTQAGQLMGTPDYMSPEQVKGEVVDERSDIYSLGTMLYELATGVVPFSGNTVYEVMIQRTQKEPRSATLLNPDIPAFLDRIIRRSMAREKEARYASVDELLADLDQGVRTGRASFGGRFYLRRWHAVRERVTWKRFAIALPIIALLAAGSFTVLQRLGVFEAPPPPAVQAPVEPMTVLIADFANTTGEAVFAGTLEQALSIGLEGASFLESFRRERARSIAAGLIPDLERLDRDAARLVAQREGIGAVITGSVARSDQSYAIEVEALDPLSGDSLVTRQERASAREEVLSAVGRLAVDVRRALGDRASEAEMRASMETFTTSSLEAAGAYAAAQRLQQQGKWQEAIDQYQAAVQLDPEMGRAYSGLAVMNFNLGNQEEADRYFLMALSQLDRMTPRERFKTQGNYYILKRDYEKAVEAYSRLVAEVPGDSLGRANLAYAAFFARDFPDAFEQGRQIADASPSNVVMRANSAWYAMFAGELELAETEAERALDLDDSFRQTYVYLALSQLARGRLEDARSTWARLQQQGPEGASMAAAGLADLAAYSGRFREAARIIQADLATAAPTRPGLKRTALAMAHLELGETRQALRAAEAALDGSRRLGVRFEASLVFLRAGETARGLETAADLSASLQAEDRAYGLLLEGEARRLQRGLADAIRLFRQAQDLADTVMGRFLLGLAYLDGNEFASAYSEFEQCLARRGEFTSLFLDEAPTFRYFPPVHFYMGKAQEGLGSPAAARSFEAFLAIRGDGASDPRVDEARSSIR